MRWNLKPTKTDQSGTQGFEKNFLLDANADSLSAAQVIRQMLSLRGVVSTERKESPLFLDVQNGHEINLEYSGRELEKRVENAGLPKALIKDH